VVGWQVYEEESSVLAADLMTDICHREGVQRQQVTLHSDNGSPMNGATLLATLDTLGVIPSFSRPSVSNDNPYSGSLFRTLKYRPEYPELPFANLRGPRSWVRWSVDRYNYKHLHSAIQFVTPTQRWSSNIRNWKAVGDIHLNPANDTTEINISKAA
jgi:putative transposase